MAQPLHRGARRKSAERFPDCWGDIQINISRAIVGALALSAALCGTARADFIFDLGTGNSDIAGFPGPYAQVDVHLISATMASITFTSLTNGGNIYLLGDGGTVAVNVNAASWTLGTITGSNAGSGFSPGSFSDGGSGNEDGFGSFNQTINSFDGFTHSSDMVSFDLTDGSGTWASADSVLIGNASGNLAGAHIFVTSFPANASNGAIVTGFASGSGNVPVPEPSSLALFSLSMFGLSFWAARRRRK